MNNQAKNHKANKALRDQQLNDESANEENDSDGESQGWIARLAKAAISVMEDPLS